MPLPLIAAGLNVLKDGSQNTARKKQFDSNIFTLLGSAITGRNAKDFGQFAVNNTVGNLANAAGSFINTKNSLDKDKAQKSALEKLGGGKFSGAELQQLLLLNGGGSGGIGRFAGLQGSGGQVSQANPFANLLG